MAQPAIDPEVIQRAAMHAANNIKKVIEDPWYAIEKGWVMTQDEHPGKLPVVRPLPAREYLKVLTREWQTHSMGLVMKSRQVMASWLFAFLEYWDAQFHDGRHAFFQGKRQADVAATGTKGLLGRARFIRKELNKILFGMSPLVNESQINESYENGSVLEAIPEGEDIIRSKVISSMIMDELAFHDDAKANWDAAVPAARGGNARLWGVTTPNGHEFVYNQADRNMLWDNYRKWPELIPGVHAYTNEKGIRLIALHYTALPEWCTPEHQAERRKGYSDVRAYMRENELECTLVEGLGVYANEFSKAVHVIEKYVPDPALPVHRGWDTGYNGQGCSWLQFNHDGQLVWFDQLIYKAVALPRVIQEAKLRTLNYLGKPYNVVGMDNHTRPVESQVTDWGEPAARAHNAAGETDQKTMSKHGIQLRIGKPVTGRKIDLVENVRQLLLPRSDGKPALIVALNSEEMNHVVAGLAGAYHYGKAKQGKSEKELPEKDGFYDHIFDGAQHAIDNINPIRFAHAGTGNSDELQNEPGVGTEGYGV